MTEQLKEIGQRLMALRDISEMTTAQVAEKLGVSEADYVAYEKGEVDFSVSFLHNCAELFGVDVADIMTGESATLSMCAYVKKGKGFAITRNKAYDYKYLAAAFRNPKAEPFIVTAEPSDTVPSLHGHEGQEFNYMLSGSMMFYLGDTTYQLEEGDSVYFDSGIPHAFKALNNQPAKFLAIVFK